MPKKRWKISACYLYKCSYLHTRHNNHAFLYNKSKLIYSKFGLMSETETKKIFIFEKFFLSCLGDLYHFDCTSGIVTLIEY